MGPLLPTLYRLYNFATGVMGNALSLGKGKLNYRDMKIFQDKRFNIRDSRGICIGLGCLAGARLESTKKGFMFYDRVEFAIQATAATKAISR